ncbi:hypothetical protein Z517_09384 [Fonsecaea pedrosoi CBS 271.37]|uniref:Uncharacterized protein n=1 Tax=Fonsecaea pedrosoi CBS 271.37 TaxID=1442368 RepID=A0A0D2GE77_9EURO|nr:uncharacterized protein Z517_09384 [Fonsecaea pedrosoi CBS 271.37]KIW76940.1 hypothetical protein Z517_09384 [Fonsecaea pedrosoi CBS 271.37]
MRSKRVGKPVVFLGDPCGICETSRSFSRPFSKPQTVLKVLDQPRDSAELNVVLLLRWQTFNVLPLSLIRTTSAPRCHRVDKDLRDDQPFLYSTKSNIDPGLGHPGLAVLSQIGEMLTARVHVIIKARPVRGTQGSDSGSRSRSRDMKRNKRTSETGSWTESRTESMRTTTTMKTSYTGAIAVLNYIAQYTTQAERPLTSFVSKTMNRLQEVRHLLLDLHLSISSHSIQLLDCRPEAGRLLPIDSKTDGESLKRGQSPLKKYKIKYNYAGL